MPSLIYHQSISLDNGLLSLHEQGFARKYRLMRCLLIYLWYANSARQMRNMPREASNEAHASRFFQTCGCRRARRRRSSAAVRARPCAGQAAPDRNHRAAIGRRRHRRRVRHPRRAMGYRTDEQGWRHRRTQVRAGDRGRDQPEGHDRAASAPDPAGEGRCHSRPDLDRRQPWRRARRRGGAGACRDVGRHHPGRRQGDDAEPEICVSVRPTTNAKR